MKHCLFILLFFTLCSCSIFKRKDDGRKLDSKFLQSSGYSYYTNDDYLAHLAQLGKFFVQSSEVSMVPLDGAKKSYFESLVERIIHSNEILFSEIRSFPQFYIVKNKIPFYFSIPDGKIFLSLGLIQKYIKNEVELAGIVTYELIRVQKKLYPKVIWAPVGAIKTERLISLLRIPVEERMELNKWVYHSLTRAGFDSDVYLSWLQTMNKSSLDFSLHLGDLRTISLEEAQLKAFIVKKTVDRTNKIDKIKKNSSTEFYQVLNGLNKAAL